MLNVTDDDIDNDIIDAEFAAVDSKLIFPATVIVDTREWAAHYHFLEVDPWPVVNYVEEKLNTGDYSLRGFQSRLTVERKTISDFLSSITHERDRVERECHRMREMEFAAFVVEGELREVLRYAREETEIKNSTNVILGTVRSWSIQYGVHFNFCFGRRGAEIETLHILYQFWRNEQKRFKALQKELLGDPKPKASASS